MFLVGVGVGVLVGLLLAVWCAVLLVALGPPLSRKEMPRASELARTDIIGDSQSRSAGQRYWLTFLPTLMKRAGLSASPLRRTS